MTISFGRVLAGTESPQKKQPELSGNGSSFPSQSKSNNMQPGSLVVIKPIRNDIPESAKPYVKWLPIDNEEEIYTVRGLSEGHGTQWVALEEGVIGHFPNGEELEINILYVKEVQPPMDLTVVLKQEEPELV